MEKLALSVSRSLDRFLRYVTPYFRQLLRIAAFPYCAYQAILSRRSPSRAISVLCDLVTIFTRHGYYPDNYSKCRLWEVPKREWRYYYGSAYNPFQRHLLSTNIQRDEYRIIFHDKYVAFQVAVSLGIRSPRHYGIIHSGISIDNWLKDHPEIDLSNEPLIIKPVTGSAGRSVYLVSRLEPEALVLRRDGTRTPAATALDEDCIVQEKVEQHEGLRGIYERSLNTIRFLTYWPRTRPLPMLISAFIRFGSGNNIVDNWSAGGVAIGVDLATGRLQTIGYDRYGRPYDHHPNSNTAFGGVIIPDWPTACELAIKVQQGLPYYRLLGLDIAVTPSGPILIEINPRPDFITQEQTCGPILKKPEVLHYFAEDRLLTRSMTKLLRRDLYKPGNLQ